MLVTLYVIPFISIVDGIITSVLFPTYPLTTASPSIITYFIPSISIYVL